MSNTQGSEALTVQVLAGPPALSQFALQRMQRRVPSIAYAEFVHILQVRAPLVGDALGARAAATALWSATANAGACRYAQSHRITAAWHHFSMV